MGTGPAREVSIESELPDKLTFVRASDGGKSATGLPGVIAWSLGDLPARQEPDRGTDGSGQGKRGFLHQDVGHVRPRPGNVHRTQGNLYDLYDLRRRPGGAAGNVRPRRSHPSERHRELSHPDHQSGERPVTNVRLQAFVPAGMQLLDAILAPVKYRVEGKTIIFEPVASLEPGAKLQYEVHTLAVLPGDMRFKIRLTADQLKEGGPVHEEESTTVYSEDLPAPVQTQRRPVEMPLATD